MFLRGKIEGRFKMVEQVFSMSRNDDMSVEKLIFYENINYIHWFSIMDRDYRNTSPIPTYI
jgi:hypothetical protein